ncbi:hypothetical protein H8959_001556 [Pygathrix nigripes]
MHTALECEVTIKPRFVYIPSPRTGPVRGGDCESRDGVGVERENRTGESGLGPLGMRALGFPQLLQSAAASRSRARGGQRVGRLGFSCAVWAAAGRGIGSRRRPLRSFSLVYNGARGPRDGAAAPLLRTEANGRRRLCSY